mmetsp:Transcript_25101/g.35044  ORF Transcript_25101/g.35044 Transcript_25101/m.35044 type:complete len:146 (+) Transcript_25101:340-777(+)
MKAISFSNAFRFHRFTINADTWEQSPKISAKNIRLSSTKLDNVCFSSRLVILLRKMCVERQMCKIHLGFFKYSHDAQTQMSPSIVKDDDLFKHDTHTHTHTRLLSLKSFGMTSTAVVAVSVLVRLFGFAVGPGSGPALDCQQDMC